MALLLLTGFCLGRGYNHDEEQFLAAAVLAMDAAPYRDFVYLQTPAYPLLLAGLFNLLGLEGGFFLTARLATLTLTMAALAAFWCHAMQEAGDRRAAAGIGLLFITSTVVQPAIDSLRNDMAPCTAMLWALVLLARGGRVRTLSAGLLLALAVGLKLSYAFAPLILVGWMAFKHRSLLPWLVLGGALGTAPMVPWVIAGWDGFVEGAFTYHRATPALWHGEAGLSAYFSLEYLAEFLNRRIFTDTALCAGVALLATRLLNRRATGDRSSKLPYEPLIAAALLFGLLPRPPYIQYFLPFVALLLLALPQAWRRWSDGPARDAVAAAILILGALPGAVVMMANIPRLVQPDRWMVTRITTAAADIGTAVKSIGASGPVLTLSPIPVLEAGLTIYPELAAGPFFYRTADRLPSERLRHLRAVGRRDLVDLLHNHPPAAILIGREDAALEQPLLSYALTHGYTERPVSGINGLRLFIAAGAP